MTDQDRSFISIEPSDIIDSSGKSFIVAFKCEANGLNFVVAHSYMGGDKDDDILVQIRFDEAPMTRHWWSLTSSHEVTLADMQDVPGIVRLAKSGNKLAVRITDPLDGESATSVFSLQGLSTQMAKLPCAE
ncbi:MAG: hypothetical protein GDA40_09140 [Rhodobacteraceae bacterium]|nr:hypothetical protein [Paracoccaceae bacterium]